MLLGKCNMDQFAMGSSNESSYFGPVRNPWAKTRVPGGSSGSSAAAVAARMAPAATGTDTGGSTRQPAAFSGICGLRPTYVVSRYGLVAFASSLDQAGPLAAQCCGPRIATRRDGRFRRARFDEHRSTKEDALKALEANLKGLRIGIPREYFAEGIEPGVRKAVEQAVSWFAARGAVRVELELLLTRLAVPAYYVIAPAEAVQPLTLRWCPLRPAHERAHGSHRHVLPRTRAEARRRLSEFLVGTYVLSHSYYDAYYLQAQKVRRLIARDFPGRSSAAT